jgi:hypothetical protein
MGRNTELIRQWTLGLVRTPSAALVIDFSCYARHDQRVLEMIVLALRGLALACRGQQELVLETSRYGTS